MKAFPKKRRRFNSLDDIVFEYRNKEYGCYNIRATYLHRLRLSFILVLAMFLVVTVTIYFWKINPWYEPKSKSGISFTESVEYDPDLIHMINQLSVVQPDKPIVLSETAEPENITEQVKRADYRVIEPLAEHKPVVVPVSDSSSRKLAEDLLIRHKNNLERENSSHADSISMVLEKVPQFPGGNPAIQTYFYKNQHYPENALSRGIHGSPIVSIVINKDGLVGNAKVVKGINPDLDREAIRLVKSMPRWQPAYYKGKPIACMLLMPVDFTIK